MIVSQRKEMKMKKLIVSVTFALVSVLISTAATTYDVVVVGATPGGIMASIAASRQGKQVLLLERSKHVGGLPVSGLGATDIATRGATTGLFMEFVDGILDYYVSTYGENSPQVANCSSGYHFEPHVAAIIFDEMLQKEKNITIMTQREFEATSSKSIVMDGNNIKEIRVKNLANSKKETYSASVFIDATYEGDLGAAAGVPFMTGREGKDEYNEIGAGRLYKLWQGPEIEGTTGEGDEAVQSYNYRLCLTNNPANRIAIEKPRHYNRKEYLSLIDDVLDGTFAGVEMLSITPEQHAANRQLVLQGGMTRIEGDPWGIAKVTNMVALPNEKTDANNQHLALISTDLPEENWQWPTADWKWRDKFANRLKEYTLGLLYFAGNDPDLPDAFKENVRQWGLAADEYQDNDHFPRQVYVREGRRLKGLHVFSANDALPVAEGCRPPLFSTSITSSHYALDSHACHKREEGKIALDGFFSYRSAVYTVPFEVIVPQKVTNLLIPVPASATHVGFSTLRMEPCWMALGQAAGTAAAIAIDESKGINELDVEKLQQKLVEGGATLMYFRDIKTGDEQFPMVEYMGLRGYLPEWEANLNGEMNGETASAWSYLSGISIINWKGKRRGDVLQAIYEIIK